MTRTRHDVIARRQCGHRASSECVCGATVAVDRVALWKAINDYAIACGADPSKHVYGNTARMKAVAAVESAIEDRGEVTEEVGRWMVNT